MPKKSEKKPDREADFRGGFSGQAFDDVEIEVLEVIETLNQYNKSVIVEKNLDTSEERRSLRLSFH